MNKKPKSLQFNNSTLGQRQLWNYFLSITDTEDYKSLVSVIRKKYGISSKKFKVSKEMKANNYGVFPWELIENSEDLELIEKEVEEFTAKVGLPPAFMYIILEQIFYGKPGDKYHYDIATINHYKFLVNSNSGGSPKSCKSSSHGIMDTERTVAYGAKELSKQGS